MSYPKVRVLNVLGSFQVGGAENFLLSLLDKHNTEDFEWAVCGLWPPQHGDLLPQYEKKARCYSLELPPWSIRKKPLQAIARMFKMIREFRRLCREYRPDVVHAHLPLPSILTQILFARSKNIALVTTYHNTVLSEDKIKLLVLKLTVRIARPVCIACGEIAKEVNVANGMIPAKLCVVVSTGVDTEKYNRDTVNVSVKNPFDDKPDVLHILQVGSMRPQKGYEYTIEALRLLKLKGIPVYVCAVGMGEGKERLEKLSQEKNVSDNIRFLAATEEEKMKLLQTADIYIMPSLWEGLSLAMLEAMSMALPLIVSSVGGALEVIEDGKSGLLIPPGDSAALAEKIAMLAGDEQLRRTLGRNARKRVLEKYSLRQRALAIENVYRKALNEKRARHT